MLAFATFFLLTWLPICSQNMGETLSLNFQSQQVSGNMASQLDGYFTAYEVVEITSNLENRHELPARFSLTVGGSDAGSATWAMERNDMRGNKYQLTVNGLPTPAVGRWTCKGEIPGFSGAQTRLSLYPGAVKGYFKIGETLRFVEPLANIIPQSPDGLYISYQASDVIPSGTPFCMADEVAERGRSMSPDQNHPHNHIHNHKNTELQHPELRQSSPGSQYPIPGMAPEIAAGDVVSNCYFLELATEADFEWFTDFGSTVPGAIAAIDAILNQVEGLYCSNFDLSFRYTNQNVHTNISDPYTSTTLLDRLFEFRTLYTTSAPYNTFDRDLGHMFTGTNLAGSAVGYAFVGVVCSYNSGFGITQRYNAGTFGQVVIAAHELGHNFSSPHSTSISCGSLGSVMCPFVQTNSFYFSPATVTQIQGHIDTRSCLGPPDLTLLPLASTLCLAPNVTFTATFNANYTYQWYRDSVAIPGANGNTHLDSVPGFYIVDIGNYDTTCTTCTVSLVASLSGSSVEVTNTNDSGPGSLRDAIINANACPGWDTILFNIPGPGPHTISPLSPLPFFTDTVFVDGYSQPGATPATAIVQADLRIVLDGSLAGNASALVFDRISDCEVAGLCINRWDGFVNTGSGIRLVGTARTHIHGNYLGTDVSGTGIAGNNYTGVILQDSCADVHIGGLTPADLNLISGNETYGIYIDGRFPVIPRTLIEGNYIGTDITGTLVISNNTGIQVEDADATQIGGTSPGAGNLISGNGAYGIELGANGGGSVVEGNLIGTDITGQNPLGNGGSGFTFLFGAGIHLNSGQNQIGGSLPQMRNVISANARGILMDPVFGSQQSSLPFDNNVIQGNYIGMDISGSLPLGNQGAGILIVHDNPGPGTSSPPGGLLENHLIGGLGPGEENIIAYNGYGSTVSNARDSAGIAFHVFFTPSTVRGNTKIFRNQIFQNAGLGIYITPGALQGPPEYKAPVLISAIVDCMTQTTTVSGELQSNDPNTDYRVEYFYNLFPDPSGTGEGEVFIGADSVLTNGLGDVAFSRVFPAMSIPSGACISTTATALDTGNTSMFSNNVCLAFLPLAYPAPPSLEGCQGDPVFFADFNPAIDVTYTIPGFGTITSDTLEYLNPMPGDVLIIQAVDTCGRYFIDTIPMFITPPLPLDLGTDTVLCPGDSLLLNGGGGWSAYQWQDNSGNPTFMAGSSGDYFVQITDLGGCRARDTISILVEGPTVDLGMDTVFCSGGILDAGPGVGWTYQWLPGGTNQFEGVSMAGDYEVVVTDSNDCEARDTINISLDSVFVDLGNDTLLGDVDSLFAGNAGCTYNWSTGETTQTIIPVTPGTYTVTVSCPSGCAYVDEIELSLPLSGQQIRLLAQAENEGIKLNWAMDGIDSPQQIWLERETEPGSFAGIFQEMGPATDGGIYLDPEPAEGLNVYRMRMTDRNGTTLQSNLASAFWEGARQVSVWPIPTENALWCSWNLGSSHGRVVLFDALGRKIWQTDLTESTGKVVIDCATWSRGSYWLRVVSDSGQWEKTIPVYLN